VAGIIVCATELIAALAAAFVLVEGSTLPPPYPRAGTTSLLDNEATVFELK
jgi:hypothetical protein